MLYVVFCLPNLVCPFLTNYLMVRIGIRLLLVLSSLMMLGAQILSAGGILYQEFHIILIGRFFLGISSELFGMCARWTLLKCFSRNELPIIFSLYASCCRFGSMMSNSLSPYIIFHFRLSGLYYISAWLSFLAIITSSLIIFFEELIEYNSKQHDKTKVHRRRKIDHSDDRDSSGLSAPCTAMDVNHSGTKNTPAPVVATGNATSGMMVPSGGEAEAGPDPSLPLSLSLSFMRDDSSAETPSPTQTFSAWPSADTAQLWCLLVCCGVLVAVTVTFTSLSFNYLVAAQSFAMSDIYDISNFISIGRYAK